MRNFFLPIIFVCMIIISCGKKMLVQDSKAKIPERYKSLITYNLPKTLLKIKIPIETSSYEKGLIDDISPEECKIVEDFVLENYGWKPIDISKVEKYSIGDKIQFIPITVPDSTKQFTISYSGSKALSHSMALSLNKDGIISSGEFAQEDKTFEYVTKGLEGLSSIAGKFFSLGFVKSNGIKENENYSVLFKRFMVLTEELTSLNQSKSDLIKNATNGVATIEPTKYRLELIDKRIAQIKEQIMGTIKKTIINLSLIYEPGKQLGKRTILKINSKEGYLIEGVTGQKPSGEGVAEKTDTVFKELSINVKQIYAPQKSKNEFTTTADYGKHFVVYNLPAKYSIQLLFEGKALKSYVNPEDEKGTDIYEIYFPQKGSMAAMPFDFKDSKVVFYEDIGTIKEIKYSTNAALNSSSIAQANVALDSIVSMRNKIKESKKEEVAVVEETKEQIIRLIIDNDQTTPSATPPTPATPATPTTGN